MNTSRMIWGTICLAIAAGLAALNFILPTNQIQFMIGDVNMPWVPPVALAILGVWLLLSDLRQQDGATSETTEKGKFTRNPDNAVLNQRLETIAWGCFLIMLGGFMFVPRTVVSEGFWSIGVGLIMLGLNAARYFYQLRMSGFTTILGVIALFGGALQIAGVEGVEGALLIIILGAYLLVKPWIERQQLFGKAEESRA